MANELKNLVERISNTIRDEKTQRVALNTTLAIQKPRIFSKGLDSNSSKIGTYSTNPISISKKNQARNTGKTYFKGGYAEYHKDIGKGNSDVNLRNTDQMMIDYGPVFNGSEFGLGFQNTFNAEKAGWLTDKYDKEIFSLTDQEVNIFTDTIVLQLNRNI